MHIFFPETQIICLLYLPEILSLLILLILFNSFLFVRFLSVLEFMFITVLSARFILLFTVSKFSSNSVMFYFSLLFLPEPYQVILFCFFLLAWHLFFKFFFCALIKQRQVCTFSQMIQKCRELNFGPLLIPKLKLVRCCFHLPCFSMFCLLLLSRVYVLLL